MNHVMIDIETLSLHPRAHVLSIGAVRFDPATGKMGEEFHVVLQGAEQEACGRVKDLATIKWWMDQGEEAQKLFEQTAINDHNALVQFSQFLKESDKIWANGPDFDLIVLKTLYNDLGSREPWHYYQPHCYRTFKSVFGQNLEFKDIPNAVKHNALSDAKQQAANLSQMMQLIAKAHFKFED